MFRRPTSSTRTYPLVPYTTRFRSTDPSGIAKYAELAQHAPNDKLQVLASKACEFKVLEGGQSAEAVVVLQFPTMNDALDWYNSDAYQKALPHRLRSGKFSIYVVHGVHSSTADRKSTRLNSSH